MAIQTRPVVNVCLHFHLQLGSFSMVNRWNRYKEKIPNRYVEISKVGVLTGDIASGQKREKREERQKSEGLLFGSRGHGYEGLFWMSPMILPTIAGEEAGSQERRWRY